MFHTHDPWFTTDLPSFFSDFWPFETRKLLGGPTGQQQQVGPATTWPPFDVIEKKEYYAIVFDCAGVPKDKIEVTLHQDQLVVSGERPALPTGEDESQLTFFRSGRFKGKFERRIALNLDNADTTQMSAKFENGLLCVKLPKKTGQQIEPKKLQIQWEGEHKRQ